MREPFDKALADQHLVTNDDPLCRCGYLKSEHLHGTGPLAEDPARCQGFVRVDHPDFPVTALDAKGRRIDAAGDLLKDASGRLLDAGR